MVKVNVKEKGPRWIYPSLAFSIICLLLARTPSRRFTENSSRWGTQSYQDVMACVVKYGKPSLFITVTCDPEWPEIKAAPGAEME
ncbi:BZ3500_MvSof-1268-A1-R1_Chr11-3g03601 [Microbotryum saponariae]|uniref:BZ3500_MvSof-1268-A1-R1_Chr11-3g03601 protein n=1 Tax=Microbotryum saponariae TaxID=289078 RepID=A0A2X0KS95_9BASI|nr:BZ3500_MvSof-1268-A1-R1_Chr11-3g03601 [Microbotryum saponariae]SDA03610.1 BZ3501_MvSof-1269-A2-R1_Chr11g03178 [Microbotryum saponariae]